MNIRMMHGPGCAGCSISAVVSEFSRAELEAFVAQSRRICAHAWVRVEHLQRVCREAMPATSAGTQHLIQVPQDTTIA